MFLVLWGDGSNGKGTIQYVFEHIFSTITKHAAYSTFEASRSGTRNDLAALRDSRYVFASEGKRGVPMAEEVIKGIAGADPITARFLYHEDMTFTPRFLLILSTNYRPNFQGQEYGIWRKVKLVPMRRQFADDEADEFLKTRLVNDEAEGIINWVVRHAVRWNQKGGGLKENEPKVIREELQEFKDSVDKYLPFIEDHIVVTGRETDKVSERALWDVYKEWNREENGGKYQVKRSTFTDEIKRHKLVSTTIHKQRWYTGIRLIPMHLEWVPDSMNVH